MKVVMTQALCREGMELFKGCEVFVADDKDPHNYIDRLKDADALIVRIASIPRDVIEACASLKVIGRPGVGYESIDVKAATEKRIPVVITPGANSRSVAEHTMALILALSKNLLEGHTETINGNFMSVRSKGKAFELENKIAGIIGFGAIGRETAKLCRAFGMKTLAFDPFMTKEQVESNGSQYCSGLDEILMESDIVTIHVPLLPETKNLIRMEQLKKMKRSSLLINCARGGIVNEGDLVLALKEKLIAGAGLDTYEEEPPGKDSILFDCPSLLLSPHSAAQTREAIARMGIMCAEGCLAILRGEKWPHVANPEVYKYG